MAWFAKSHPARVAAPLPLPLSLSDDKPLAGIGLMLLAMCLFSAMDGTSKVLAAEYHPVEIAWGRYLFTMVFAFPFVLRRGVLRTGRPLLQVTRGLCMLGSAQFFIFGLVELPIAEATAIGFVAPLLVTALSIPFLGERVGLRRWSAVIVGFAGVLIVIRPGTDAFEPAALYPVLSAACWGMGVVITRKMRNFDGVATTLLYSTLVGLLATSAVAWPVWTTPDLQAWGLIALLGLFSCTGQYFFIAAFSFAGASLLAPFSYSQIVWSGLIGFFVFATLPDGYTWLGAAVIVGSGIYTLHRERVLRNAP
jgi:drug/metabolite transporter (DMT)-like permease